MITFRDLVPPAFWKVRQRFTEQDRIDEEIFPDFDAAARFCGSGWEDAELAAWVVRDAAALRDGMLVDPALVPILELRAIAAVGWVLAERKAGGSLSVVDFGGSAGVNYFAAKAMFRKTPFAWSVVETKAICKAAAALTNDELRFVDDLARVARPDLVFSVGAVQYHPRPLELISQLMQLQAPYLVLFRTAMSDGEETFCAVQRATLGQHLRVGLPAGAEDIAVRYPVTFVPRIATRNLLQREYQIVAETDEGVLNRVGRRAIHGYGMLCKKRGQ